MDKNRRTFLKVLFVGSGALLAEKVLGPLFPRFFSNSFAKTASTNKKIGYRNFQIVENKRNLSVYDNSGEEIFQIDDISS